MVKVEVKSFPTEADVEQMYQDYLEQYEYEEYLVEVGTRY
jgi:hypothetical protein